MKKITSAFQIGNVWPGATSGCIFNATDLSTGLRFNCFAQQKSYFRIPCQGEYWYISGHTGERDPKYGIRLTCDSMTLSSLPDPKYLRGLFLKHPMFRGFSFGKGKIDKLLSTFTEAELIAILNKKQIERLSIEISLPIAITLIETWSTYSEEVESLSFFIENGIPLSAYYHFKRHHFSNLISRLKQNPYALVVSTISWELVDKIGKKLEIPEHAPQRLVAAVEHCLYSKLDAGDSAYELNALLAEITTLLGSEDLSLSAITAALEHKAICILDKDSHTYVQLIGPAYTEHQLAIQLKPLLPRKIILDLFAVSVEQMHSEIVKQCNELAIITNRQLSDEQISAVSMCFTNRLSLITGHAGTGKTSVISTITAIAKQMHRPCYLLALSGKAVERITQVTGHDAYTIHRFILLSKRQVIDLSENPLIVIDEASMVDPALAGQLLSLFDKIPFSLVMVGDPGQISPVGWGLFWHVLLEHKTIPITHLTKGFRTQSANPITSFALNIRAGMYSPIPEWNDESRGVYLVSCEQTQKALHMALTKVRSKLLNESQILTPRKSLSSLDSADAINLYLQAARQFSLDDALFSIQVSGKHKFYVGDPVIATENNYEAGLFNGETGQLDAVEVQDGKQIGVFRFGSKQFWFDRDDILRCGIQLAYAITIHKSQGSEYPVTIVCCMNRSSFIERSMIYTAVTRSSELCLIIGSHDTLQAAIEQRPRCETIQHGFSLNF